MHFQKNKKISDVYFSGSFFYHTINEKKGRKTSVNKHFIKDNKNWIITAYYTCPKGIVMDICIETDADEYRSFCEKFSLSADGYEPYQDDDTYRRIEKENPLNHNFHAELIRNKKLIRYKQAEALVYIPDNSDNKEAKRLMKHYKLSENSCWSFYRISFPCYTKSKTETLALRIIAENEFIEAAVFTAEEGKTTKIIHPVNQSSYIFTCESISDERLIISEISDGNTIFPKNYKLMKFSLSPEPGKGKFYIRDKKNSDSPKILHPDNRYLPDSSQSIGIIGGADGTTVLIPGNKEKAQSVHSVCSSLYFEKPDEITWKFCFIEKTKEDKTITIKGGIFDVWPNLKDESTAISTLY